MPPHRQAASRRCRRSSAATIFSLQWSGRDGNGSGIASYSVYFSDDGGAFRSFLSNTTQTSSTFTGVNGHSYGFYSVATDNVGNQQPTPTGAQATTTVDATAPTSSVSALPTSVQAAATFNIPVTLVWKRQQRLGHCHLQHLRLRQRRRIHVVTEQHDPDVRQPSPASTATPTASIASRPITSETSRRPRPARKRPQQSTQPHQRAAFQHYRRSAHTRSTSIGPAATATDPALPATASTSLTTAAHSRRSSATQPRPRPPSPASTATLTASIASRPIASEISRQPRPARKRPQQSTPPRQRAVFQRYRPSVQERSTSTGRAPTAAARALPATVSTSPKMVAHSQPY